MNIRTIEHCMSRIKRLYVVFLKVCKKVYNIHSKIQRFYENPFEVCLLLRKLGLFLRQE